MQFRPAHSLGLVALLTATTVSAQTFTVTRGDGSAQAAVSAAATTAMPAGHDFASEVIGDPWDFEQPTDWDQMYSLEGGQKSAWVGIPQLINGVFTGTSNTARPDINLQFEGISGGFNMSYRSGVRYPIDAAKYRRLSFRVRRSVNPPNPATDLMAAMWYSTTNRTAGTGAKLFVARGYNPHAGRYENQMPVAQHGSGWQIYKVDLDANYNGLGMGSNWAGTELGLDLRLGDGNELINSTIEVDWVRLTERGTATATLNFAGFGGPVTVTARHAQTGDVIQVFPDNGTDATTFADGSSYTWDYGFLPPGTWTITSSGRNGTRTAELVIDPAPVITVLDPDVSGGKDFASTTFGDPWDLTNAADVTRSGRLYDMANASFGANGLTATTLGRGGDAPNAGDAFVALLDASVHANPVTVNADEYYRLTFTLEYLDGKDLPGDIALRDTWGSMARVIWHQKRSDNRYYDFTTSQDIIMLDGGPLTFSMDLRTLTTTGPVEPGLEPMPAGASLWTGQIGILRIDVNEASGVDRPFRLANVKLAQDDEPNSSGVFPIRWAVSDATFSRAVPGGTGGDATVTLYYDTDTNPAGRVPIASGIPASQGTYNWDVTALTPGTYYVYATVTDAAGNQQSRFSTGPVRVRGGFVPLTDNDHDGMPDAWELRYGLSQPDGDEDGDGVSNLQEYQNNTDPRLANRWVLPEGATGYFTERLAMANPNAEDASVTVRYLLETGGPITKTYSVPGNGRISVNVNDDVPSGSVSAVVEVNSGGVVVERTMFWGDQWYGGHTGKALQNSRTEWFLAEGEAGFFDTYILLANPGSATATVTIQYLLEGLDPIVRTYEVLGNQRVTIYANDVPGLRGKPFSSKVTSNQPINVERAMYFSTKDKQWAGGHEAAAVEAASTDWFVAEGTTVGTFDTYLLLANPNEYDVTANLTFLKPGGNTVSLVRTLPRLSRTTLALDIIPGLESTDVSTKVSASGPIVVERAMYWGTNGWIEAHDSAGVTTTGTRWAMAEGEFGGSRAFDTYILLANPTNTDASVMVTLLRTGGRSPVSKTVPVQANSRVTLSAGHFDITSGEQFGILIDSGSVPVVAERAMYWNGGGEFWGGGTNETAVRLR